MNETRKQYLYLFGIVFIVTFIYSFSFGREWQIFDEKMIFEDEGFFPIAANIKELFELISTFAFNYHIESQNVMFSNIINIRSNTIGAILNMVILFIFKKNIYYYHSLQIFLHLANTIIVWFIFK